MLAWVVERARMANLINKVVVATTIETSDDLIVDFCTQKGYPVTRGSMQDVLDRYYQTARQYHADIVVRLTADCPLIDPGLIDETIQMFLENGVDFAANRLPPPFKRTYPIGMDTEVVTMQALETAWNLADQPFEREHVMPYFYEKPGRFRILQVDYPINYGDRRWTVDTAEDLALIREIISRFDGRMDFTWLEVLGLFEMEPELARINALVQHKTYLDVDQPVSGKK